jgi:two-component system, LytTR family, sensor kinase
MKSSTLVLVYAGFFFMYFFGFEMIAATNAGVAYPWHKQFHPLNFSGYSYTIGTAAAAHFLVFRKYYYTKPRWKLAAAIGLLLLAFIVYRYLVEEQLFPALIGIGNYNPGTSLRFYFFDNVYYGSIRIFIGFVLFLFDELIRSRKQQAALKQQQQLAELRFLEAQMNPHFLFNSLNNIYSLAYEKHPETATAVLKLSDLMRYVTYERGTKASLEKELSYIHNMLAIEQLRHDYKLQYTIQSSGAALECRLNPLLIIPLVENALKHGDLSDPDNPLKILIEKEGQKLNIVISNKIGDQPSPSKGGLGLPNLERRLALSYRPEEYRFKVDQTASLFTVNLQLPA